MPCELVLRLGMLVNTYGMVRCAEVAHAAGAPNFRFPGGHDAVLVAGDFHVGEGRRAIAGDHQFQIALQQQLNRLAGFFGKRDAEQRPIAPGPNFEPKPPPIYWQSTSILLAGRPEASVNWAATPETACVEGQTFMPLSLYSETWPCGSRQQCVMQEMP